MACVCLLSPMRQDGQSADGRTMVGWTGTLMPMNPENPCDRMSGENWRMMGRWIDRQVSDSKSSAAPHGGRTAKRWDGGRLLRSALRMPLCTET
jgi:hypothetical protein